MLLILMRHGIAEPLSTRIKVDAARPLTTKGRDVTAQVAQGLHQLLPPLALIAHSPKVRARETAELVRDAMTEMPPLLEEWQELLDEDDFHLLEDRIIASRADILMLVGHEPNLSLLVAWLACDMNCLQVEFKKLPFVLSKSSGFSMLIKLLCFGLRRPSCYVASQSKPPHPQ